MLLTLPLGRSARLPYIATMDPTTAAIEAPTFSSRRRSRMHRAPTNKRLEISERDIELFRLLSRYRYLRSSHLHMLAGGRSHKRFVERLGHLYHEGGYIDRPAQQWQAINARYMPAVYELGDAGERLLVERGILDRELSPLLRKGRQGAVRQYHHDLMVCDILSSIEIGVRADPALRFVSWQEILASPKMPASTRAAPNPLALPAEATYTCSRTGKTDRWMGPLVPDALFGIEYRACDGKKTYRFFAVEADRNTEPIARHNLQQTSYLRKLLQYRAIATNKAYTTHLGLPNLLVLTVTTNDEHTRNIMQLLGRLTGGRGSASLLFRTMPSLASLEKAPAPTSCFLTEPWQRVGHQELQIDRS